MSLLGCKGKYAKGGATAELRVCSQNVNRTVVTLSNGERPASAVSGGPGVEVSRTTCEVLRAVPDGSRAAQIDNASVTGPVARWVRISHHDITGEHPIPQGLLGHAPCVALVQTTEARHRSHRGARCRLLLDGPLVRGVFFGSGANSHCGHRAPNLASAPRILLERGAQDAARQRGGKRDCRGLVADTPFGHSPSEFSW
jgi:hypothetical protein